MPAGTTCVDAVIAAANAAVRKANHEGDVVVAIANAFNPWDPLNIFRNGAAVAGTSGAAWDERVARDGAAYFEKWRGDAFCNPSLETFLRNNGVEELTLAGLMGGECVSATARGALRRGFKVRILAGAVADRSDEKRRAALARLERQGVTIDA